MKLKLIGIVLVAAMGFAQLSPPIDLWRIIRKTLTGPEGESYFEQIKGAEFPPQIPPLRSMFDGKVVSQPSPRDLRVNVDDPAGDATLHFYSALRGMIAVDTPVHFVGVVDAYTKNPYMLTFDVDAESVTGLPADALPERSRPPR